MKNFTKLVLSRASGTPTLFTLLPAGYQAVSHIVPQSKSLIIIRSSDRILHKTCISLFIFYHRRFRFVVWWTVYNELLLITYHVFSKLIHFHCVSNWIQKIQIKPTPHSYQNYLIRDSINFSTVFTYVSKGIILENFTIIQSHFLDSYKSQKNSFIR